LREQIFKMIDNSFGGWNNTLNDVVKIITQSPDEFNHVTYEMIQSVYSTLLPLAYNLLALFFLIEFLTKSATLEVMKWEQIAKILFKTVLAKVIIENTFGFLNIIFTISSEAILKVDAVALSPGELISDVTQMIKDSVPTGPLAELAYFVSFLPDTVFMKLINVIVMVISYGRMIEIYILTAVAPLPIATFTSSSVHSIGKKFFQSYASVCLQGLFILLVTKLYGAITAGVAMNGEGWDVVGKMLITSLTTVTLLIKSGTWAKQITGAV